MSDRETELRNLVARLSAREAVDDAFLAKSFTDRLLVVDVPTGRSLPEDVRQLLADHDLSSVDEVYDERAGDRSVVGDVGDATRHQFVDLRTRDDHQSYVVE